MDTSSLHVDLSISILDKQFSFMVINVYAGLIGYRLVGMKGINVTGTSYSYFAIELESENKDIGSMLAYYPYNSQF